MIRLVSILLLMVLSGEALSQAGSDGANVVVVDVSVREFKHLMDSLPDEVVVDLRTPEELAQQGKIAGAVEIDYFSDNFEPAIQALDTGKVYLLYCAGGGRSGETAEIMRDLGFKQIYNLKEGFKGWAKQKMPVTKN